MQLPEKAPGKLISVEAKKTVILEWHCATDALCTCSVVWSGAWEWSKIHREDTRHRQGADTADRQSARQPLGVFEEVAVWRCKSSVFLSGGVQTLNCMLCAWMGQTWPPADGINFVSHTSRQQKCCPFLYDIVVGFELGIPPWCSHLVSAL